MKWYNIEIVFTAEETDSIKVLAKCQGQAERMALEGVRFDNPHGNNFEINHVEEITESITVKK